MWIWKTAAGCHAKGCVPCWVDGCGPRVLHQELGEVGLALGEIRYRGCTDHLISVPGIDKPFLQQRIAQETVKFEQDSE